MNSSYSFSSADDSFINVEVISTFALSWFCGGLSAYMFFTTPFQLPSRHDFCSGLLIYLLTYPSIIFFIGSVIFLSNPFAYLNARKRLFKYNENTILSIDSLERRFTYKHKTNIITFSSYDVEKWYWNNYGPPPPLTSYIEIVDIRLKTGEQIIISSGIGNVCDFFRKRWNELGLPQGHITHNFDLKSYIKEVSESE